MMLPRLWLMTDERMGGQLLPSIAALPQGSGIIFRHYQLEPSERLALFRQVQRIARARRHMLLYAGSARQANALGAAGAHGRGRGVVSHPVHSLRELIAAERCGAQLLFVSPVFPTRSHPGGRALGRVRFGQIVRKAKRPVIALGGMDAGRALSLRAFKIAGWAAIDALTPAFQSR